jgi:23S rRNA pseudouridine2605 synthase
MKDFHKKKSERPGEGKEKKKSVVDELEAMRQELRGRKSTNYSSKKEFNNSKPSFKKPSRPEHSEEKGSGKKFFKNPKFGTKTDNKTEGVSKERAHKYPKGEFPEKKGYQPKPERKEAGKYKKFDRPNSGFNKERYSDKRNSEKSPERSDKTLDRKDFGKRDNYKSENKRPNNYREENSSNQKRPLKARFDKRAGSNNPEKKAYEGKDKNFKKDPKKTDDLTRLNKFISNSGICSRRDADNLIQDGKIKVNDKIVTELGYKVKRGDEVKYNNKILKPEKMVYVLLNKPKDFITTTDDPENRKTIMDLVDGACPERIYPVGRLDRNTTGLIILTNDGELADKLAHPSNNVKKIYQVDLDKPITKEHFETIKAGITLDDGLVQVDDLEILSGDKSILGIEIHVGRNRIVRRIFEHLGYEVVRLDRVMYAGLTKKDLPRGQYRFLTEKELINLKHLQK